MICIELNKIFGRLICFVKFQDAYYLPAVRQTLYIQRRIFRIFSKHAIVVGDCSGRTQHAGEGYCLPHIHIAQLSVDTDKKNIDPDVF